MKPVDHALDRLFRAAARAPGGASPVIPPGLAARVLEARRHAEAAPADDVVAVLPLFRRGLAVASLIAVVTVLLCHRSDSGQWPAVDSTILDSVAELSLLP